MLERFEARRLMSAVFYDGDSMSVKVRGTHGDDHIRIIHRDTRILVYLNDQKRTFDLASVRWIEVDALVGDDFVSNELSSIGMSAFGGGGRDTILGGFGDDFLDGQDGSDRLIGNSGNDELRGGGGRDRLYGNGGHDTLRGEGNDDTMLGGNGNDLGDLSRGRDTFIGGDGADYAVHPEGRGTFSDLELESLWPPPVSADPLVSSGAAIDGNGNVIVTASATHFAGGYGNVFGDVTRSGAKFSAAVIGEDFGGPGAVRAANIDTDKHVYSLGKLADGSYTFEARNGSRILSRLMIQLTNGKLQNTPGNSGPRY